MVDQILMDIIGNGLKKSNTDGVSYAKATLALLWNLFIREWKSKSKKSKKVERFKETRFQLFAETI